MFLKAIIFMMTKKYTSKHLESVPEWYIEALQKSVEMVRERCCGSASCPAIIYYGLAKASKKCNDDTNICKKYLIYKHKKPCPCYALGPEKCTNAMQNLIDQWRTWAGLKDGE